MKSLISTFSNSFFKQGCKIFIDFDLPSREKNTITVTDEKHSYDVNNPTNTFVLFESNDPISGVVTVKPEKAIDHAGIKIELFGEIIQYLESKQTYVFASLARDLVPAGSISEETKYKFSFKTVDKEYESYRGANVDVRYYMRVTIIKSMFSITKEQEFWVHIATKKPSDLDPGIAMEVGLEGIVLLSIKYENMHYDIGSGRIFGKLKFYLVNVKIDKAEISIIRKETTSGAEEITEHETLKKFEIIDGTPAKDEVVPVRFYLASIEPWKLTCTSNNVNNKYSVKYFLHLALCDTKQRKFFKQKEIFLYRDI